ncbi:MAG TPA: dihydrodipicolinate synthase family protein [Jiangellales bacterium]|nr:dihydrodipicolinate synthase family protein [Jiangellales bacterium]
MTLFTGVGVALVTAFDEHLRLDGPATADLAVRLVDDGVRAVVVAGSTGEADTLEEAERVALVAAVRGAVPVGVPVLAGTGGAWAGQAVARTRAALDAGADGVLVLSPRRVEDARPYYEAVATAAAGRPVLAYHFPAVSAPGIPVRTLPTLPVDGVKDSTGDAERLLETLAAFSGRVYTGSSALLSTAGPLGADGAILAAANVEPILSARAFAGDVEAQRRLLGVHLDTRAGGPAAVKRLAAERYGTPPYARLA